MKKCLTPAVFDDKLIYSSGSSRKFIALNKTTSKPVYQMSIRTGVFASPTIAGETVYQGDFLGVMTAINVKTGKPGWTFETDGVKQDKYGLFDTKHQIDDKKYEAAINKYKGQKQPLEIFLSIACILSSPVVKDKVIYFGATDGNMYALE